MRLTICITLLFLSVEMKCSSRVSYKSYKVYRIHPRTDNQLQLLKNLEDKCDNNTFSYWKSPSRVNSSVDLMVSPEMISNFKKLMKSKSMKYKLYIKDVQQLIDKERIMNAAAAAAFSAGGGFFNWKQYQTLSDINDWLQDLEALYPTNVKVVHGGRSFEDRNIVGVRLSFGENNPGVFIEGGIHAREWISPATVTYLLNEFLTSQDLNVKSLAMKYDWYFFPVLNPDGYVYSHTTNRLWRKTTRPVSHRCHGVDLNRNWGYLWRSGRGASKNPCHATYAGPSAFSEIETRSLSQYLQSLSDKLIAYISFHSYSQLLMFPYGHTKEKLDNYAESLVISQKAVTALSKKYGTQYKYGNIAETLYSATGGSIDWVKSKLKLPIVFIYELRDRGRKGFLLPPAQIIPNGQEVLDSFMALFKEAEKYGYSEFHRKSRAKRKPFFSKKLY